MGVTQQLSCTKMNYVVKVVHCLLEPEYSQDRCSSCAICESGQAMKSAELHTGDNRLVGDVMYLTLVHPSVPRAA